MFYLALTWEIQEELEAWWTHYSQPIADRSSHLPSIGAPRRKELYDWSGSSPLILSILLHPDFQGKTEDQVIEMFAHPTVEETSAYAVIRDDIEGHYRKKFSSLSTDDAKFG